MSRPFVQTTKLFFPKTVMAILWALTLFSLTSCTAKKDQPKEVNLAIWGNYLTEAAQKKFTEQTGIKINVSNYSSNEELLAKVQSGASGIDIAVPSDYMVDIMIKSGLLEPLNKEKLPNVQKISADLLNQPFDAGNKYSLPYTWTTAGIAVNRELFKGKITSWKDLFESKELAGKISLLDDVREVAGAALKYNGYSVNTTNKAELEKAKKTLLSVKPKVKMFRSDTIEALVNKEVAVAHTYSTDALQAASKSNGTIEYIIPSEGSTRAIDNLVLVKGGKNTEAAHVLLNYLLQSEVNKEFVQNVFGGPVVSDVKAQLPEALQKNASLFPNADVLSKLERIEDLGENTQLYDQLWTDLKVE